MRSTTTAASKRGGRGEGPEVLPNGDMRKGRKMVYRVYKGYAGTKCIRKFDNLQEAQMWCWSRDREEPYRIEWEYENGDKRRMWV